MRSKTQNYSAEQTSNYLNFNNLPSEIQERLLRRQAGKGEGFAFKNKGISSAYFLIASALVWFGVLYYLADDYLWNDFQIILFTLISLGTVCLLVDNFYRLFQWLNSRSKNYLLITPHYVIDLHFNDVWYWNLDQLNMINSINSQQNGVYTNTQITLSFGKESRVFSVKGVEIADEIIEQIYHYKKLFAEALARNDNEYLNSNDDFIELHNQVSPSRKATGKNLKYLMTATASIILAAGIMFGAISLNNYFDDQKSWDSAQSISRASSFREYLQTHPHGRWASNANEKLQSLYDAAEQKYQSGLNNGYDQKAVDAVLQTLRYAKATQNFHVKIAFERHNEIPADIVEQLKKEYDVKKILPFDDTFSEDKMIRREGHLFTVVANGFREVIPDDILEFSDQCVGECVTFLIKYKVSSKDSLYYDPREKKLPEADRTWNPGIFIDWDFNVTTPNQSQNYNFTLSSLPAEHITYDSNAPENLSENINVEEEMKVDKSNLYDAMVSSAFDDFKANLVYRMGIGAEPKPKVKTDEDKGV